MNKQTIIHKSKTNFEEESHSRVKEILNLKVVEKMQFLNKIQSKKFPNLKNELNAGCIIYKFPLRPQDYRYIFDKKQIPQKHQTISYDILQTHQNSNEPKYTSIDNHINQNKDEQSLDYNNSRFKIKKSIPQIQQQILSLTNQRNKVVLTGLRRETNVCLMPQFYLKKSHQNINRNQSEQIDSIPQQIPRTRGKSVSQIVSYASRPQTGLPSRENRFMID